MKKKVTIEETLARTIEVEAESDSKAISKVEEAYKNGEYVLSADDYASTMFHVEGSRLVLGEQPRIIVVVKGGKIQKVFSSSEVIAVDVLDLDDTEPDEVVENHHTMIALENNVTKGTMFNILTT